MSAFRMEKNRLIRESKGEILWIESWGSNSLRVRAAKRMEIDTSPLMQWSLLPQGECLPVIEIFEDRAAIKNGKIKAFIDRTGKITFHNQFDDVLLEEYRRTKENMDDFCSDLNIRPREFIPIPGGDFSLTVRFEANHREKLFGMGQYQQPYLDLKGSTLELAQRNSQASVPFVMSSLGYGFFWNNPGIGEVSFSKNMTKWNLVSTKQMDYWITAGDNPAEIEEEYGNAVGKVPMMPDFGMGFWQSKLRYRTQNELLEIAREYKRRKLPISVIVIDFFHWPNQGTWMFDEKYWPDPVGMVRELKEMNIEVMVSIWPTVDSRTVNFKEMQEQGLLVTSDRGPQIHMRSFGEQSFMDATHPKAREYVWGKIKNNYYDKGIRIFWLDEAEPEYDLYSFDNYRYHIGTSLQTGNVYPMMYAKMLHDGLRKEGQDDIISLVRCAWAGSQKYGALVWSGDIHSSFASMRNQLAAGLSMAIAGIPWWTTDIGGFYAGNIHDASFKECIIRWFQYGAFCPVFRLHGDRLPAKPAFTGELGGGMCKSGADNEVWSYGEEAYGIFAEYMFMRERLRPYIKNLMKEAHEKGTPPMRPLFYDFPDDMHAWEVEDQYMFGPDILVSPILELGIRERPVYLPLGSVWKNARTNESFDGGATVMCAAPIEVIPLFLRNHADLPVYPV